MRRSFSEVPKGRFFSRRCRRLRWQWTYLVFSTAQEYLTRVVQLTDRYMAKFKQHFVRCRSCTTYQSKVKRALAKTKTKTEVPCFHVIPSSVLRSCTEFANVDLRFVVCTIHSMTRTARPCASPHWRHDRNLPYYLRLFKRNRRMMCLLRSIVEENSRLFDERQPMGRG